MLQSSSFLDIKHQCRAVSRCLLLLLFLIQPDLEIWTLFAITFFILHFLCYIFNCIILFSCGVQGSVALVVPNDLPSILSVVYSNIPPIKKGTDSRLGFGFRLGQHADFQVLLELGPQKETRPIGDQDNTDGSSFNKRQVNKIQQIQAQEDATSTEQSATAWLEKWSNGYNSIKKKVKPARIPPAGIPAMPQLPNQTLKQLQMLYKMATTSTTESTLQSFKSPLGAEQIKAAIHLQERLKVFKARNNLEELQTLHQAPSEKTKAEITKELMDVSLDK